MCGNYQIWSKTSSPTAVLDDGYESRDDMVLARGDAEGYGVDSAEGMPVVDTVGDWMMMYYTMVNAGVSSLSKIYLPSPLQYSEKNLKIHQNQLSSPSEKITELN